MDVWYQFFVGGIVFYNSVNDWSVILDYDGRTWARTATADALISSQGGLNGGVNGNCYGTANVNRGLFMRLMPSAADRSDYEPLISSGQIVGGIGTVYVRENLWGALGKPLQCEQFLEGALYIDGSQYDLLVDVMNRETDVPGSRNRAVIALLRDGTFVKHTVITGAR